jgi:hypothetical protein
MTTEHSHQETLKMLQASTKPPIIATDGSVKLHRAQGTFAWVLADQDGTPWLRCRGPVSGTPINSFHSEACALLSVLVYLNLMADYFKASIPTIKIYIYILIAKATSSGSTRIDIGDDKNSPTTHSAPARICIRQSTEN